MSPTHSALKGRYEASGPFTSSLEGEALRRLLGEHHGGLGPNLHTPEI